jgi:hypothetical protein
MLGTGPGVTGWLRRGAVLPRITRTCLSAPEAIVRAFVPRNKGRTGTALRLRTRMVSSCGSVWDIRLIGQPLSASGPSCTCVMVSGAEPSKPKTQSWRLPVPSWLVTRTETLDSAISGLTTCQSCVNAWTINIPLRWRISLSLLVGCFDLKILFAYNVDKLKSSHGVCF